MNVLQAASLLSVVLAIGTGATAVPTGGSDGTTEGRDTATGLDAPAAPADAASPPATGFDPDLILPPAWAFGVLHGYYTDQAGVLERLRKLREGDFPVDAIWVDSAFWDLSTKGPQGYINFTGDRAAFPDVAALCRTLHTEGVRFGVWVWDRMSDAEPVLYREMEQHGFFRDAPIVGNTWHNAGGMATSRYVNFEDPSAAAWWKDRMRPLLAQGLDFFKLDSGPRTAYVRTHFELTQEGRLSRGRGFLLTNALGSDPVAIKRYPAAWTGDSIPNWHQENYPDLVRWSHGGLRQQIDMVANPTWAHYRHPFLTNDTGGFRSFPELGPANGELYMRWVQFSAFGAVMEVFGSMFFEAQNAPFTFPEEARENFRRYTHLRMRLFPYIYTHAHLTRQTGRKMIQGDAAHPHQYVFGRDVLLAPVHEPGVVTREVWLPEDSEWMDYWTGARYVGGQSVRVPAPLERLPLFIRAGAIIPMRDYAPSIELGSNARLTLDIYPAGRSEFTLYEDDGLSNDYLAGGFATTRFTCVETGGRVAFEIGAVAGHFDGQPAERTWVLQIHRLGVPRRLLINGQPMSGWSLDERGGILRVELTARCLDAMRIEIE